MLYSQRETDGQDFKPRGCVWLYTLGFRCKRSLSLFPLARVAPEGVSPLCLCSHTKYIGPLQETANAEETPRAGTSAPGQAVEVPLNLARAAKRANFTGVADDKSRNNRRAPSVTFTPSGVVVCLASRLP